MPIKLDLIICSPYPSVVPDIIIHHFYPDLLVLRRGPQLPLAVGHTAPSWIAVRVALRDQVELLGTVPSKVNFPGDHRMDAIVLQGAVDYRISCG